MSGMAGTAWETKENWLQTLGSHSVLTRFSLGSLSVKALGIVIVLACTGIRAEAQADPYAVAKSFAVLGATTVTNTGSTTIFGNLGVSPGTAITGFPPGVVTGGSIHSNDALAGEAKIEAAAAYVALAGLSPTQDLTGQNLGGLTLTAGVYHFSSSAQLTGQLTLSGPGDFVFQIGSTLTTASSSSINLINCADACNVYFTVGSSATLGTYTDFTGTIIAIASDTLNTGADVDGRVIALNGAVTLDDNNISTPCAVPEPSSVMLVFSGLACLVLLRKWTSLLAVRNA